MRIRNRGLGTIFVAAILGAAACSSTPAAGPELELSPGGSKPRPARPSNPSTIPVGDLSAGVAITRDRAFAYVTNERDDTVSVVNTETKSVAATVPVGDLPSWVAITLDGARVMVTNAGDASVSVTKTTPTVPGSDRGGGGCSVSPGEAPSWAALYLFGLVALWIRSRRRRSRPAVRGPWIRNLL